MGSGSIVSLLSGGLDSTVMLHQLRHEHPDRPIIALSFDYGQRHGIKELNAAVMIARAVRGVEHQIIDLTTFGRLLGQSTSSLTNREIAVPDGHYADESMRSTVVPNRNMVMLAMGASIAVANDADILAYGAHAGDHYVYPDCRPAFANAISLAILLGNDGFIDPTFTLMTPFIHSTKADIVALGAQLGVPFSLTWSCYKGGKQHCSVCGTCAERRACFEEANVPDPTSYALDSISWNEWKTQHAIA